MKIFFDILKGLCVALSEMLPLSGNGTERVISLMDNVLYGSDAGMWFILLSELGVLAALFIRMKNEIYGYTRLMVLETSKFVKKEEAFISVESREILLIICALVPVAMWYFLKRIFAPVYDNLLTVVLAFFLSGCALIVTDRISCKNEGDGQIKISDGAIAGVFRLFGFIPGFSGTGGMLFSTALSGFSRRFAYKFAMLMCIPVYIGGIIMRLPKALDITLDVSEAAGCVLSFALAFAIAYFLFDGVKKLYESKNIRVFSIILFILSLFTLILWMRG